MEQFKVAIPADKRVNGWLYDAHSGLCMGIASDEMKAVIPYNTVFKQALFGCPYELVIHYVAPVIPSVHTALGIELEANGT